MDRATDACIGSGEGDCNGPLQLAAQAHRCFGDARTAAHARVFNYETYMLVEQRRFAEAEAAFERFFADYADVAEPEVVVKMHLRRGYLYGRLGRTAEMLAEYARAAARADQLPPPEAANTLRHTGQSYRRINDLETASRYLAAAESLLVPLHEKEPGTYGHDLGVIRLHRARVILNEGEQGLRPAAEAAAAAGALLESALDLLPPTPPNAFNRALALTYYAQAHWMRGDPEAALAPFTEAHRLSPWFRDAYPQLEAALWRKEAYTFYLLGRYDEARRGLEKALARARAAREHDEEWRALVNLGEVAEAEARAQPQGDYRLAERYFRQAAAVVEETRRTYGTHVWSALAWEDIQEPYLHLTRVLLRQGRPAEAFLTLDAVRARYLRDLRTATRLRATLDLHAAARLDSLTDALTAVRDSLRDPAALPVTRHAVLQMREITLQQEVDEVRGTPEAAPDSLTVEAVQRALQPRGQVLVTYFLDEALPTAFVVRAGTLAAVALDVEVEALQAQIRTLGWLQAGADGPEIGFRLTPLHALYEALYAPLAPLIPPAAPLVVVPDRLLDEVPFGLLLERAHPPFSYADAPYLLRHHPITVELAAALLTEAPRPTNPPLDLLALGRSRFGPDSPERLQDLPNVGEELQQLRRRVGNARIALDEEATESFFDAHRDDARVIHLASHVLVNPQFPLYSRVVLWDDPAVGDDGTLHLYELYDRPLNADLVTLSGCRTAWGRRRTGEGLMGLQYAFRAAGARATLATLWQVDDAASAELMGHFYEHLRRGLPKDEALRQAQLDYLGAHEGPAASPFFWAAFVLYGDPAPAPLAAGRPMAALWLPGGLLLVLAGVVLPRLVARVKGRKKG